MKIRYLTRCFLFVAIFAISNYAEVLAAKGDVAQFAPVEIGETLKFHIRYFHRQGSQGAVKPLTSGSILRPGDFYGIEFTPFSNCYVYIFQTDGSNTIQQLFPENHLDTSSQDNSNPVQSERTYHIPLHDTLFQIDPSSIPKQIYFLASSLPDTMIEDYYRGMRLEQTRQNTLREALFHTELLKRIHTTSLSHVAPIVESEWIEKQPLYIPELEQEIVMFFDFQIPAELQQHSSHREAKGIESTIDYETFESIPKISLLNIFEEQSDLIVPEAYPLLHEYGKALQHQLKHVVLIIAAHTDNRGSTKGNLELSRRRAETIKHFFNAHYQIAADRLLIQPYGDSKPILSNETAEGRRLNNRIEFIRVE